MTALASGPVEQGAPDYVAGSLLRSLGHPIARRASWGLFKTILLAGLTFGLAPLLIWPRLLNDLIAAERNRFLHLAEWMRGEVGYLSAERLSQAANRVRPVPGLTFLPSIVPLFVIAAFVITAMDAGAKPEVVMGATWGYLHDFRRTEVVAVMFLFWTIGLGFGYLLHWLHLLIHIERVRGMVTEFNHRTAAEGLAPIPVPAGVGIRPMWLLAGVGAAAGASAMWAIPAVLGGALQRRYATVAVPVVQGQIGFQVRQLLSHRRPTMTTTQAVVTPRRCPNPQCRATMARIANFCPRCGKHVGPVVNALA